MNRVCYCTNIHPGESWDEIISSLKENTLNIQKGLTSEIGLRISARALKEVARKEINDFKKWLALENLKVCTVNAFPYGNFNKGIVKKDVYLPDWQSEKRVSYTLDTIELMLELDSEVTISTVPLGWKDSFQQPSSVVNACQNLLKVALRLRDIYDKEGIQILVCLEPEPGCYLENTESVIRFFNDYLFNSKFFSQSEIAILRQFIGICFDVCHFSTMFESAVESYKKISQLVDIHKVQVSSGLKFIGSLEDFKKNISSFKDGRYLHQLMIQNNDQQFFLSDLENYPLLDGEAEFRVHYHVPIFLNELEGFQGTNKDIVDLINYFNENKIEQTLEVETYTFEVLPAKYQEQGIRESIRRELKWLINQLH